MANPYAEIFRAPGAKGLALAGFLARMPLAMAPIGIVTMLSQQRGEYWLAGAVAATFAFTNAIISPQISRLVDRQGQRRVLLPVTAVSVAGFLLLLVASYLAWPLWMLFAGALLAALMPSMPAMVRARWTEIFSGRPELNTAFAFESAADEMVYIAGASLSVGLSVALFPEAGVLISTLLLSVGTIAFIAQRSTEPKVHPALGGGAGSAIRQRPVQLITLALIFVGMIFATAEVTAVALTREFGQPGAATFVIGVYAVGSFIVGLVMGALRLKAPLHRQMLVALTVLAATQIPLLWASSVPMLGALLFLSGIAISPTFITAFGLIERRVPADQLTEGVTWVITGIGIGMALGAFVAGWAVDTFGARHAFWISVMASSSALGVILLAQRALAGDEDCTDCEPQPAV